MAKLEVIAALCLLCTVGIISAESTCAWPAFFDVSVQNGQETEKLEINSWETKIKIKKKDLRINGKMKQNMWLTVMNNETVGVTYDTRKRDLENKRRLHYSCVRELDDYTYLVTVMRGEVDENNTFTEVERPKYKCIQFIKRSPFVLQWRDGPESEEEMECVSGFAPIKPWPLVHLPVRKMPTWDHNETKHDQAISNLLKQYQSCPNLGGFQIRVFGKDGKAVNGDCKNDDPSPRLEFECVYGDGMRIIQSQNCTAYSDLMTGSKLNCLATWEDGRYQFSVVVPSYQSGINSFHCLRLNKEDPTKEPAVLFLDTICGKGELVKSKVSNFQLELRRITINSLCDDTSDQCSFDQCDAMNHSCLATCDACPANDTVAIDPSIHGIWVIQTGNIEKKANITENEIDLFGTGSFEAYSYGSSEAEDCIQDAKLFSESANPVLRYLLGGVPKNAGCGPRVTSLRAKKISDSVMLAQISSPAPLRANSDISRIEHWCRNNFDDVNSFAQLFRPIYPFQATTGIFQNRGGYLTLIKEESTGSSECMGEDQIKDVTVSASLQSDIGHHQCDGNLQSEDDNKKWNIKLTCSDYNSTDASFACLGRYKLDMEHSVSILRIEDNDLSMRPLYLKQDYYCLIIPSSPSTNSTIIFHNAGECDTVFKTFVDMKVIKPLMTLTISGTSSAVPTSCPITFFPVLLWLLNFLARSLTMG